MFSTDSSWPNFTISVAGIPVRVFTDRPGLARQLSLRYTGFSGSQEASFTAWVETAAVEEYHLPGAFLNAKLEFHAGAAVWETAQYRGLINLSRNQAFLSVCSARPQEDVDYFLRVIYALLAFGAGGLLFHAAGVDRDGGGFLFFGPSGSGKTTVARLSPLARVLNDDLLILLPGPNGWVAHSTPFWNPTQITPSTHCAPLVGLYRLVQDCAVFLETMGVGQALAEMIASVPVIPEDPMRSALLLARCRDILAQVPAYRLHFLPDDSFWEVVTQVKLA